VEEDLVTTQPPALEIVGSVHIKSDVGAHMIAAYNQSTICIGRWCTCSRSTNIAVSRRPIHKDVYRNQIIRPTQVGTTLHRYAGEGRIECGSAQDVKRSAAK